jgi:DNA-directed RNA polymerase specialized sigma24 family protein
MARRTENAGRAIDASRRSLAKLLLEEWQKQIPPAFVDGSLPRTAWVREFLRLVGLKPAPWRLLATEHLVPRLRSVVDIDDVLQEALLSALLAAPRLQAAQVAQLVPWFKVIVLRSLWHALRKSQSERRLWGGVKIVPMEDLAPGDSDSDTDPPEEPATKSPCPDRLLMSEETLERIMAIMLSVGGLGSEVMILIDALEATLKETAKKFGLSRTATVSLLNRARERVRPVLLKEGLVPSKFFRSLTRRRKKARDGLPRNSGE